MKIYKHYFDKSDTPFVQSFQQNKKFHTVWKHNAYKMFLDHSVHKIKIFGLFTLYEKHR